MKNIAPSVALVARCALALVGAVAILAALAPARGRAQGSDAAWEALRDGGKVVLIRHALAPGMGDPPGFTIDDCATQRNLSGGGRAQATRIGEAFAANGVAVEQVLTRAWCRCIDTATLAFGAAEVWAPLNSFFRDSATAPAQTEETRAQVAGWSGQGTLVLVTHQVNMTELTGIFPDSGEAIVLTPAPNSQRGFMVAGGVVIP